MAQSIITLAFETYKAQREAALLPVELDEFVLANVPGLDPDAEIDRSEDLPPVEQIVFTGDVTQAGYVSPNAVVYSLIMDTSTGDFDFNWVGLRNKETGILAAILHTPVVQKYQSIVGVQNGNAVTRSVMMAYEGAKAASGINVDASTWQIDFTARLQGIDETERLANLDLYGAASFYVDGFKVTKSGSTYQASAGSGYVGGLRCYLDASQTINGIVNNADIYLDASWLGQLTSAWDTTIELKCSAAALSNYVDADGFTHFVTKIAHIDDSGSITDLRYVEGFGEYERIENAATDAEIDAQSTASKHVKLSQLWRAFSNKVKSASTTVKGIVQLSNSYTGDSETKATTEKAVKDGLATKLNKSTSDTIKGILTVDRTETTPSFRVHGSSHGISGYAINGDGGSAPMGTTLLFHSGEGGSIAYTPDQGASYAWWVNNDGTMHLAGGIYANGPLDMPDGKAIKLGDGDDMVLFHNGTHSYLDNYTGALYLRNLANSGDVFLQGTTDEGSTKTGMRVIGGVGLVRADLLYNDEVKLSTTPGGVLIDGELEATTLDVNGSADINGVLVGHNDIISGKGSGGVALTINDGYGNANVTFNHQNGKPEQAGSAYRIEASTDNTTAEMSFELKSDVVGDTATSLISIMKMREAAIDLYQETFVHSWFHAEGITVDNGTSSTVNVLADSDGMATLSIMGRDSGQATGRLYVGQSPTYGGGIEYNGDDSPTTTGAGADYVTLFRRNNGANFWTARNKHDSNAWEFRGEVQAPTLMASVRLSAPSGTTSDGNTSDIRWNPDEKSFQGHNGDEWGDIGGGARGASGNKIFYENDTHVTGDYTITAGKNAMSAGPITIDDGVTVTVPIGSTWTVV